MGVEKSNLRMKKKSTITLVALVMLCMFSFSSCIREYTCVCTITHTGAPGLPAPAETEYTITDSRKVAIDKCAAASKEYTEGGIKTVEDCKLD